MAFPSARCAIGLLIASVLAATFAIDLDAQNQSQAIRVFEPVAGLGAGVADAGQRPPRWLVRVRPDRIADASARGGTIELPLSNGQTVRANVTWAHADATQTFLAGPLVDGPSSGEVSLTLMGETLVGRVVVDDRVFVVRPMADSALHFVETVGQLPPDGEPVRAPLQIGALQPAGPADAPADTNAFVDLLVVYTPVARSEAGGTNAIMAEIQASVNNANVGLANAGVTHRFRLARAEEISYVETTGNSTLDLSRLRDKADGFMDSVHALRDQYRADVVSLFFKRSTEVCGRGYLMGPSSVNASFEDMAFNVVNWDCANENLTLAHEIGHNMGLEHDPANAGDAAAFPYAYGYSIPGFARDIMAYECTPACPKRTIFSTPLFNFPGSSTKAGTANNDNARALNNTSTAVANFRQTCTYTLSASSARIGPGVATYSVNVTATSGCTWVANSNAIWLSVLDSGGTGNGTVRFVSSTNSGALRTGSLTIANQTFSITQIEAWTKADFDVDSRSEIAIYRPTTGDWFILPSSANYSPAQHTRYQWGLPGDMPIVADFDGDGKTDPAVYRPSTGYWSIRYSTLGYAVGAGNWLLQWGLAGDQPLAGDFDGDRKSDLVVYRPSTGQWWVRYSNTNYTTHDVFQWGLAGDQPIVGDFDGDKKTDIVVYRPATGEWFIRYSSFSYVVGAGAWLFQWGLPGDLPQSGDFDGDKKTDIVVYRPATGEWFIRYSSLNYGIGAGAWLYQWGLGGDLPVVADFDGDGKAEIAVYRPSTGYWFIRYSSLSYAIGAGNWLVQWGLGGDQPLR